jgi:hypothetical protein
MRAPLRVVSIFGRITWEQPDAEWLADQYFFPPEGQGKSIIRIAREVGVNTITVRSWLVAEGLFMDHPGRQSARMKGENNPSFRGGSTRRFQKGKLREHREEVCEWCGLRAEDAEHHMIHLHHRDHDEKNVDFGNLAWLCHHCNVLEAMLWALRREGRAVVHAMPGDDDMLVVTFPLHDA